MNLAKIFKNKKLFQNFIDFIFSYNKTLEQVIKIPPATG